VYRFGQEGMQAVQVVMESGQWFRHPVADRAGAHRGEAACFEEEGAAAKRRSAGVNNNFAHRRTFYGNCN
jgi:hypothetical protein